VCALGIWLWHDYLPNDTSQARAALQECWNRVVRSEAGLEDTKTPLKECRGETLLEGRA
jgi:hypothetical protein